ncbi:helix-turn-helix transcriptional regulator [Salaquimonas pukyongi]|uniref:helix-turn-helix transcriptional regulator n=1 Tax=Salaquimonas pukyongi TaxID=2712698 RepID=UPI00096BB051|nr:LuxR C-terminal-related transcriptional regulator [Salaquimonas pukyongi]
MPGWEVLVSNWPDGLTGALTETLSVDPDKPSVPILGTAGPFCLTGEMTEDPQVLRLVDAGLTYTLLFKVHHLAGGDGVVCFSGDRHAASEMELMCLQFYAMLLYDRIVELAIRRQGRKNGELSRRELECLRWIAKGKTSSEIGIILGLSENTINNYIVNACRKIGAVNRIHAVYLSLKMGLIS